MDYFDKAGILSEVAKETNEKKQELIKERQFVKAQVYEWLSEMAWKKSMQCAEIAKSRNEFPKKVKSGAK